MTVAVQFCLHHQSAALDGVRCVWPRGRRYPAAESECWVDDTGTPLRRYVPCHSEAGVGTRAIFVGERAELRCPRVETTLGISPSSSCPQGANRCWTFAGTAHVGGWRFIAVKGRCSVQHSSRQALRTQEHFVRNLQPEFNDTSTSKAIDVKGGRSGQRGRHFISFGPNTILDGSLHAFGRVVDGMQVVEVIETCQLR
jgi:hypothetical protein